MTFHVSKHWAGADPKVRLWLQPKKRNPSSKHSTNAACTLHIGNTSLPLYSEIQIPSERLRNERLRNFLWVLALRKHKWWGFLGRGSWSIYGQYMYNTCTIHVQYMYNTCTNVCTVHLYIDMYVLHHMWYTVLCALYSTCSLFNVH